MPLAKLVIGKLMLLLMLMLIIHLMLLLRQIVNASFIAIIFILVGLIVL